MECKKGNGSRSNEEDELEKKRNWKDRRQYRKKKTKEIEECFGLNESECSILATLFLKESSDSARQI